MAHFSLQFPKGEVKHWASRYNTEIDSQIENIVGPFMRREHFLTKPYFIELGMWKSSRTKPHYLKNTPSFIKAATRAAADSSDERFRIDVLKLLDGVGWPIASAILHFGVEDRYPILDFRALQSLGYEKENTPKYNFDFWWAYVQHTRSLAKECGVTMRELDRALWQFSKENTPQKKTR